MVILITGASHTGKTVLAQRMLEKTGYPYLSIDHLKMGLIRSGATALTPEDDGQLTDYLWPIVREMIRTAIENRQDLIVEGCYVPFSWRKDFDERYLSSIRFVCLAMTDAYIDAKFDSIRAHACEIESRLDDSNLSPDRLKAENRAIIAGFQTAGEQVVLIDGDWETAIGSILDRVERRRHMIRLKKYEKDDRALYEALVFNADAMKMNYGRPFTPKEAELLFSVMLDANAADGPLGFYKVLSDDGFLGMGALNLNGDGAIEIEYMLLPQFWRRGYGTTLVETLVRMAKESGLSESVEAITDPGNAPSRRILQKTGFARVKQYENDDGDLVELYRKMI